MTIKSIETRYAGCRFRSRLEARWAVFFDHLGIEWEYEPQGFELSHRITGEDGTFRYLPDFWLPTLSVWAEVKGDLTDDDTTRLLNAAAALSSNEGGGCGSGHDLAVFGHVTSSAATGTPIRLHMHKGDLEASCLWCGRHTGTVTVATDAGDITTTPTQLLRGYACFNHPDHADAFAAARTARFEFGQVGAR